ncbi:hypothetical protein ACO0LO_19085 [Undibacterium sp. TJN25]|uniref:hypothetical protein n=1 Tax=Undibacterium sp. TJN25 TaxID=3413056 RepID=UPI003BEF5025
MRLLPLLAIAAAAFPSLASAQLAASAPAALAVPAAPAPFKAPSTSPPQVDLAPAFLKRIHTITDAFEKIDGISYEQAVDLYKRDPERNANLALWEEILKAYKSYCHFRCKTEIEQMDVYRVLLLRSMYTEDEALRQAHTRVLKPEQARTLMRYYSLPPKPMDAPASAAKSK